MAYFVAKALTCVAIGFAFQMLQMAATQLFAAMCTSKKVLCCLCSLLRDLDGKTYNSHSVETDLGVFLPDRTAVRAFGLILVVFLFFRLPKARERIERGAIP